MRLALSFKRQPWGAGNVFCAKPAPAEVLWNDMEKYAERHEDSFFMPYD